MINSFLERWRLLLDVISHVGHCVLLVLASDARETQIEVTLPGAKWDFTQEVAARACGAFVLQHAGGLRHRNVVLRLE